MKNATITISSKQTTEKGLAKKYLVHLTTRFSEEHQNMFRYCWPELLKQSKLLQGADIFIFSYNATAVDDSFMSFLRELYSGNPSFHLQFASPTTLQDIAQPSKRSNWMDDHENSKEQLTENEAIHLGFSEGWFAPYSWIVRIHPDVLIRKSEWLLETMNNPIVDGIFVECSKDSYRFFCHSTQRMPPQCF